MSGDPDPPAWLVASWPRWRVWNDLGTSCEVPAPNVGAALEAAAVACPELAHSYTHAVELPVA